MSILGEEAVTRRRFGSVTWGTNGKPTAGASVDLAILASIQPATGKDLEVLEEGLRGRDAKRIYTTTDLRTADDRDDFASDHVLIDGLSYQVEHVKRERSILAHYRAICVRLREDP